MGQGSGFWLTSYGLQIPEVVEIIAGKNDWLALTIKAHLEHCCYATNLLLQLRMADLVHIF